MTPEHSLFPTKPPSNAGSQNEFVSARNFPFFSKIQRNLRKLDTQVPLFLTKPVLLSACSSFGFQAHHICVLFFVFTNTPSFSSTALFLLVTKTVLFLLVTKRVLFLLVTKTVSVVLQLFLILFQNVGVLDSIATNCKTLKK